MRFRPLPLAALIVLAACAHPAAAPAGGSAPPDSGIEGRAMVDGGCAMVAAASACPDRPLAAKLTVTRRDVAGVVATAVTGADGRFRIPLPPGAYTLHPANLTGGLHPAATPTDVTVAAGRYTTITVQFDSGVR